MNVVGRVGSLIFTPFHPFGGAVDVIVVEQQDGTYRSTPWYVRFGKFQGVLKGAEKIVRIAVNGVEASFHMYLDNSGEAYFVREVKTGEDKPNHWVKSSPPQDETQILDNASQDDIDHRNEDGVTNADEHAFSNSCPSGDVSEPGRNQNRDEDANNEQQGCPETSGSNGEATSPRQAEDVSEVSVFAVEENSYLYEFRDDRSLPGNSVAVSSYGAYRYEALDHKQMDTVGDLVSSQSSDSEVVLVSRDGHVLTAPISLCENADDVQLDTTKFHLVPSEASGMTIEQVQGAEGLDVSLRREDIFKSCLALCDLHSHIEDEDLECANPESIVLEGNDGAQDSQENNDKECLPETSSSSLGGFDCVTLKEPVTGGDLILERENGSPALSKEVPASESEVLINESPNSSCENLDRSELQLEEEETNQERAANSKGCIEPEIPESQSETSGGGIKPGTSMGFEISLCGNLLRVGMGVSAAAQAFDAHRISEEEFKISGTSIIENENLIIRWKERYLPWDKAAPIILGMAAFGLDFPAEPKDAIPVEQEETPNSREDAPGISSIPSGRSWRWPIPFRRVKTSPPSNNPSHDEAPVDSETSSQSPQVAPTSSGVNDKPPQKQFLRTNIPIIEQIASLNLKDGQNVVTFSFCTRVLGKQQVDAHIYLWKWNARIVISDVDGTITRSDVLGQFMPLVGKDWTQSGVARLFSAIKENGYHLLFLSARAISQAYLTRSFLLNLKQDGKALPSGPVVISPDGLLPSLYREVIRRAPHEFKIACLEEIRALFPCDYNPFYAGFGNRDTDELSYRKIGIPKGKIFIINPKGEVAINRRIEVKSYTSLHTLVHDMFPPASRAEQEDFNSWNYWKIPLPDID